MERPQNDEYNSYYGLYVNQAPEGDLFEILNSEMQRTLDLLSPLSEDQDAHRYEEGKWSVKEVLGHILDTERIFAIRALSIARGETADLPGMDQDVYADNSNAHHRPLADLLEEYQLLRRSNIALFRGLDPKTALLRGRASGFEFTVRSFLWIIVGHEIHHRRVLEERYLPVAA